MKQQKIIIITAPSGSGKTTLVKRLLASHPSLSFSISACTRQPRVGEVDGKDYYFLTEETFKQKIDENEFAEWEMVYTGKYYGTLKSELQRIWGNDKFPLIDIDVKGAIAMQQQYPESSISIFIQAPSIAELRNRLVNRGTDSMDMIEERIKKAEYELSFSDQFDTIVVNDDLVKAEQELTDVIDQFLAS